MAYMEVRDPTLMDLYDADPDLSTPDHTTNSEPDALLSHLAEQERAFSEDNVNDHGGLRDGGLLSTGVPGGDSHSGRGIAPVADISIDIHSEDGEYSLREAVVYREAAVDNSCVVNVGDGDGGEYSGGSQAGRKWAKRQQEENDEEEEEDDEEYEGDDFEDEESFKECYPNMANTLQ